PCGGVAVGRSGQSRRCIAAFTKGRQRSLPPDRHHDPNHTSYPHDDPVARPQGSAPKGVNERGKLWHQQAASHWIGGRYAVRVGLQIPVFTWPAAREHLGATFGQIARRAEDAGFASLWVMDHFFQLPDLGPADDEMLEGWTALAFAAGQTTRITL